MWIAIGAVSLAIWIVLLVARGGFWMFRDVIDDDPEPSDAIAPAVAVVIPARDEADTIGRAVASLMASQYSGALRVIVVDDHSTDGTADAAKDAGDDRVTVVGARPLPLGWTGKLWAVAQGVEAASATAPDFLLFTDADIVHAPDNIARLVARAERDRLDIASIMVRLRCWTVAERFTVPAFVFFFSSSIRRDGLRAQAAGLREPPVAVSSFDPRRLPASEESPPFAAS